MWRWMSSPSPDRPFQSRRCAPPPPIDDLRKATVGIEAAFQVHHQTWSLETARQRPGPGLEASAQHLERLRQRIRGEEGIIRDIASMDLELELESLRPSMA